MTNNEAVVFECTFTPAKPSRGWDEAKTAKWAQNRAFYTCNTPDGFFTKDGKRDILEYMADEDKCAAPDKELLQEQSAARLGIDLSDRLPDKSEAKSIDEYMTRFNSLGAFNLGGTMTKAELEEWQRNVRKTKSAIWHGVISIPFKQSLYTDVEKFQALIRQTFGGFLKNAGFDPNNIALLCTVHQDKPHKHVHFAFYEKEPTYLDKHGNTHYREHCKIDKDVLSRYRASATEYLDAHKADFYTYRDEVLRGLKAATQTVSSEELYAAITALESKLPRSGRLQYNSDNIAPFRSEIDMAAMMLLRSNPQAFEAHKQALKEIARRSKALASLKGGDKGYIKDLNAEYRSRLGNVVLGMVKQMRFAPKAKANGKDKSTTKKQHKANARRVRQSNTRILQNVIRTLDGYIGNIRADYTAELHRTEHEIAVAQRNSK